jgi:GDPmannose 4,6-dehydratase
MYFRPAEVETLLGDPAKAKSELGWQPRISFEDMVKEMVSYDMKEADRDALCKKEGFKVCNYDE